MVADETFFLRESKRIRKILAVEMEIASLFSAVAEIHSLGFAVKAVSDYGTPTKDDAYHAYAAEASARWMHAFVVKHGVQIATLQRRSPISVGRRPRHRAGENSRTADGSIRPEEAAEILVLVAQFSGAAAYDPTGRIYQSLSDHLLEVLPDIGRVERLSVQVGSRKEALSIAKQYEASMMVWGTYDELGITPRYEATRDSVVLRRSMIQLDQATRHQLQESFERYITHTLPDELNCLSLCAVGQMCLVNLNMRAAVKVFDRAIVLAANSERHKALGLHEVFQALASAHLALRDYDKAIAANGRGIDIAPEDVTLLLQRLFLMVIVDRPYEFESLRERILQRASELSSDVMEADLMSLFETLAGKSPADLRQAFFKSHKQILKEWEDSERNGRIYTKDALSQLQRGLKAARALQLRQAIGAFDAALRLNPNLVDALLCKAQALVGLERQVEASPLVQKAEELDPANPMVFQVRAILYHSQDLHSRALECLEKAMSKGLPPAALIYMWADTLVRLDRDEEALSAIQEHSVDPADPDIFEIQARSLLKQGFLARALEAIEHAIAFNPDDDTYYVHRSEIYVELNEIPKAIADLERALQNVGDYREPRIEARLEALRQLRT